jgi:two-component system, LytTR family, response regulator
MEIARERVQMASEKQLATPIRAVLVDDEPLIRKRFRQMLSHHPEIVIVGEAATAAEAGVLFSKVEFDLALLDVVMPEANGFSLISRVPPTATVVFVTAHERFARQAFDVAATDYLLKPVDPDPCGARRLRGERRGDGDPRHGPAGT